MKTTLYLIRHGETEWNLQEILQGHHDSPLTPKGTQQAHILGERLLDFRPQALCSSDLGRSRDTAEIINRYLKLDLFLYPEMREKKAGIFEGHTWEQVRNTFPEEYEKYGAGDPEYCIPGGETHGEAQKRILQGIKTIVKTHLGHRVVVVTHGGVLHIFLKFILGIPLSAPRKFALRNSTINCVIANDTDFVLETLGDSCHLSDGVLDDQESISQ